MKYTADLRRSRIEVATVTVEADDAAGARIAIEGMVRDGKVPKGGWQEESIGATMIGSPRRDSP